MSILDEKDKNTLEAPEESVEEKTTDEPADSSEELTPEAPLLETLTLEALELDVSEPSMNFTATLHFEFSDIFNAIEHIETKTKSPELESESESELAESAPEPEPEESDVETDAILESEQEPDTEKAELELEPESEVQESAEPTPESEPETVDSEPATETEIHEETESESEPDPEEALEEPESEATESEDSVENIEETELPDELESEGPPAIKQNLQSKLKSQDKGMKKLLLTVCILFVVIAASIAAGLIAANSLVDKANVANEQKIAEMQANIKEANLSESLYDMAAEQVIDDVAVPTYTLDELYALDLREKTGFTAEDLKVVTRKGLVGCEEAFVKAEKTYGVNSIFLISIASLESAHGTMMFRPNNMFGYGRTGFSSKEECIMTVAKGLGTRYLPPGGSLYGGSPTLKGVNKRYAANPQWYYKVGKYMQSYYAELAAEKNGALDKFK